MAMNFEWASPSNVDGGHKPFRLLNAGMAVRQNHCQRFAWLFQASDANSAHLLRMIQTESRAEMG